jgi:hypothetical protein
LRERPGSLRGSRRAVADRCRRELTALGFAGRKAWTAWRLTSVKFDIVELVILSNGRCASWGEPYGSFLVEVNCLFPFLPRLNHVSRVFDPASGYGQLRLHFHRTMVQREVRTSSLWWAGDDEETQACVGDDVLQNLRSKALPFFERFEDRSELLRTLQGDEDAMGQREGVWEFGKPGSITRLLYMGFAAIELSNWELATRSLRECEVKVAEKREVVKKLVAPGILPYVVQGLEAAAAKRKWQPPFPEPA